MVAARITETIVDDGGRASGVVVDDGVPMAETTVDARDAARSVVEPPAMAAPTVSPTKGEVWLAERSNAQHGSCGPSQSPSHPGPGSIFA